MKRLAAALLALACCPSGPAQVAESANTIYRTLQGRQREAFEMGHPNRKALEDSGRLVASLGIKPGDIVADIGTGVGYMLDYLVRAVGPNGRVIAEDIFPDLLSQAEAKVQANGWANVSTVLGTEKTPALPAAAVDLVLVLDVYHHFDYPDAMLGHIRRALKPGGRLIVIEFYRSRKHPRTSDAEMQQHIRADKDEFIREIAARRFHLVRQFDHLPYQYVLVFR